MRDYLLMIYPISLLVLIFAKSKLNRNKTVSSDFISIGQSKMIQASACIAIILHHITQDVTVYGSSYKGPVTMLNYIGIFFTALFFFFSGYGLITSLLTKSDYLDGFLPKRLPTVLIPFWFINTLGLTHIKCMRLWCPQNVFICLVGYFRSDTYQQQWLVYS